MTPTDTRSYILCSIAGTTYALRSDDVRHMELIDQITPVPTADAYLEGVVFSRGQIVPVLNLRARFGFEKVAHDARSRLVVVQSGERWVGLVVDSAREFVRLADTAIQPPSHALTALSANYVDGVATLGDRLVLVLNIDAVLDTSALDGAAGAATAGNSAAPSGARGRESPSRTGTATGA